MNMHWSEAWRQARLSGLQPRLKKVITHRDRGSEIAEKAVITGSVVAVGIGMMLAFMNGLGTFFQTLIAKIMGMVP